MKPIYSLNESILDPSFLSITNPDSILYKRVPVPKFDKQTGSITTRANNNSSFAHNNSQSIDIHSHLRSKE